MQSEKLMLSWQEHHGALVSVFESLLQSRTLVDCTLAAEGQSLKAHKVVLSACSPYFQMLFTEASEKHPIVFLKDVKFQEVKAIVDFMYRGEVEVSEDRLGSFLAVANSLHVKGLDNTKNTNELEKKLPHTLEETRANRNTGSTNSGPWKPLEKHSNLHPNEQNTHESAQTLCESVKANSDDYSSRLQHDHNTNVSRSTAPVSISSTYSVASTSCPIVPENSEEGNNVRKSSIPVQFPIVLEKLPTDTPPIKTEPASDSYEEQHNDLTSEHEREDFMEETSMLEDTNGWIEPSTESIHQPSADHQYANYLSTHVKTEDTMPDDMVVVQTPTSQGAVSSINVMPLSTMLMKKAAQGFQWRQPSEDTSTIVDSGSQFVTPNGAKLMWQGSPAVYSLDRFRCPVCRKTLSSSYSLKTHMRIHTGEKPYKCRLCDYSAAVACNLQKHLRTHTGERPFLCNICGAAFSQINSLHYHQRIHERERFHACNECDKKFASSCSLRAHRRGHHGLIHVL